MSRRTPPEMAVTPAPTRAGVFGHGPHDDGLPPQRGLQPRRRHAGHDGEHPGHPRDAEGAAGPLRHVGLHRQHRAGQALPRVGEQTRLGRGRPTRSPACSAASSSRRSATGSTTVTSPTPAHPERSSPPSRAPPIFPPPTMSRLDTRGDDTERSTGLPPKTGLPQRHRHWPVELWVLSFMLWGVGPGPTEPPPGAEARRGRRR